MSVSLANTRPAACSSAFSGAKFSMMPLWTSVTRPAVCGWALRSDGAPCVAQRVWPMPTTASSGASPLDPAVDEPGDAGGIVAAVLQPLEALDQPRRHRPIADDPDDAAH